MARVRRRGHHPLLHPAPARSRVHQIEPAEDHRRRHRLALPRGTQTRAEGVTHKTTGRLPMPPMQTRRRFLTTLSLAGAAGLVRARPALAGEGAPEITSVRI